MGIINLKTLIMNGECVADKRTLMASVSNLQEKSKTLKEIVWLAEKINQKFERTVGEPSVCTEDKTNCKVEQRDLIGILEDTTTEIQGSINSLGNNLERALNYID